MNILPHKSWHVRTKKNIARVRADEAKAAEEEKETQRRIALAVQEDRTRFLRDRASKRVGAETSDNTNNTEAEAGQLVEGPALPLSDVDLTQQNGHINFFQEIEEGTKLHGVANKEHEEEKKKEQEDYEKKIGYLVYLGQNSLEHSKDRPWYERIDRGGSDQASADEIAKKDQELADLKLAKLKDFQDPLKDIRKYLSTPGMKPAADTKNDSAKRKQSELPKPTTSQIFSIPEKRSRRDKKHKHKKEKKHKSRKHSHSPGHKKKKKRSKSKEEHCDSDLGESDSDDEEIKKKQKLEKLRAERLERERLERRKAEKLLEELKNPGMNVKKLSLSPERRTRDGDGERRGSGAERQLFPAAKQKYNSQFNPHLARQNYDN